MHGWRELAGAAFPYDTSRYYTLKVENEGPRMRAYIDGKLVLEASDPEIVKGKAGLISATPARFQDFRLVTADATAKAIAARIHLREQELTRLRAVPRRNCGRSSRPPSSVRRNAHFGDLMATAWRHADRAKYPAHPWRRLRPVSCLTAVTLDGKSLQKGRPDATACSRDNPFQIHDIDGDGKTKSCWFAVQLQILTVDGRGQQSVGCQDAAATKTAVENEGRLDRVRQFLRESRRTVQSKIATRISDL